MKPIARDAVFALDFEDDAPALLQDVISVAWTPDVLRVLKQIRDEATARAQEKDEEAFIHLPYAHLRAQLQLETGDWVAMNDDIGLRFLQEPLRDPAAWGRLAGGTSRESVQKVHDAFARWSEGPLAHYSEGRGAHALGIAALRKLGQEGKVVRLAPSRVQVHPWGMPFKAGSPTPFDVAAGVLAARLAGKEIFPGLGPVVRVVGGPENNRAEVMTRPCPLAGGRFSLVCEVSLETLPGALKPLVYLRFKRRRWADSLNNAFPASPTIGGFVFPHAARPHCAFRFSVMRRKDRWTTDLGYPQYEYAFDLAPGYQDDKVLSYPCDDRASVVVMVKAEVAEASQSELQAGVPLVDQADAFAEIAKALRSLGLRPFADFKASKAVPVKAPPLSMLKAEVALARLLERHVVAEEDEAGVEDVIETATAAPSSRWFKSAPPAPDPDHGRILAAVRTLVKDTACELDATRQTVYLVSQTADDIEWVKTTVSAMLGDGITVISVPLPANTHGPRQALPQDKGTRKQRFDARVREWLKFADTVRLPERAMVLIQAPMYYDLGGGQRRRDDKVNKLAARKALASIGCTVQYLLPSEPGRLDRFLPRLQAAVLDLVFGHAGSVWGLRQACDACFGGPAVPPRWVGAVSSLLVHTEWDRPQSVFVATRLECASGRAWVRFAHQAADVSVTPWMRFDEGARYLASGRIELPRTYPDQRRLLEGFFESTFDELAALDPNAVVFIDSTRAARLAPWLTDVGVRDGSRPVAPGVLCSQRWPTLRLLRIREQAPVIGQEKRFEAAAEDGAALRTWTSTQRLFQVGGTAAPTFWSLARPSTHHKRGASCYRDMMLPNSNRTADNPGAFARFPAQPDKQHLNARALEVVIMQRQLGDDDIQLASFAQHLRAGMLTARNERWVTTPSPLRIIDKLTEYMKA